jgi:hypothetical protein
MGPPPTSTTALPCLLAIANNICRVHLQPIQLCWKLSGLYLAGQQISVRYPGARRGPVAQQLFALVFKKPLRQQSQVLVHTSLTYTDKRYQLASGPGPGEHLEWAACCVAPYLPALWKPLESSWNTSIVLNSDIYSRLLGCSIACGASAVVLGIGCWNRHTVPA